MLSDREAAKIRQGLEDGLRGPIIIRWLEELLEDREERREAERETAAARPRRSR